MLVLVSEVARGPPAHQAAVTPSPPQYAPLAAGRTAAPATALAGEAAGTRNAGAPVGRGVLKLCEEGLLPASAASAESVAGRLGFVRALDRFVDSSAYASYAEAVKGVDDSLKAAVLDDKVSMFIYEVYCRMPTEPGFEACANVVDGLVHFNPALKRKLPFSHASILGWSQMGDDGA
jgi:hypothetical protein